MVVCLIGCAFAMKLDFADETKTKVVCEECELSQFELTDSDLASIKMTKLSRCLADKKRQIEHEEEAKKTRKARSTNDDEELDTASFGEIFKTSAHFKRILKQLMGLKQTVASKAKQMQKSIDAALVDMDADYETEEEPKTAQKPRRPAVKSEKKACDNKLRCEKSGQVLKIKQAVLTNENNEEKCAAVGKFLPIKLEHMDDKCVEKNQTTRIMSELCDGLQECEFSIALDFQSLCECADKKHLEIEYTCEDETSPSAVQSRTKRSMYYQNSKKEMDEYKRYQNMFSDYYGGDYYGYDYYPYDYYGYDYYLYPYDYYGYDYYLYPYDYYGYDYLYGGLGRRRPNNQNGNNNNNNKKNKKNNNKKNKKGNKKNAALF